MRYVHFMLLIALCLLSGCDTPEPQQAASAQTTAPAFTATASATPSATASTPTQPVPTATFIPTSVPAATIQPPAPTTQAAPTVAPPTPTAIPPTPAPAAPAEFIIISRGEALISIAADGSTRPIEIEGIELRSGQVMASSDGSWLAGPTKGHDNPDVAQSPLEPGLVLYNTSSGERKFLPQAGTVSNIHFSPDNTSLIFTVVNWEPMIWQINILDLRTSQQRVLQEGADANSLGLVPGAWTTQGIIAYKQLVFGSDGGPEGLYVINPGDGSIRTLIPEGYTYTVATPNGSQIAVVTGTIGLGIENPTFSLSVLNLVSDETTQIESEQSGGLIQLSWSPDSTKLLYSQPGNERMSSSYVIADPTLAEPQRLTLPVTMHQLRSLTWRDNDTLLLLVEEGDRDTLYELPIADPNADNLKQIASISSASQQSSTIVYVARQ